MGRIDCSRRIVMSCRLTKEELHALPIDARQDQSVQIAVGHRHRGIGFLSKVRSVSLLKVILEIAIAGLDFADGLLDFTLCF